MGRVSETITFLHWYDKQPATFKVLISGNHDFLAEEQHALFKHFLEEYPDIIYLENTSCILEGLKLYGNPYTPPFMEWGFMANRPKMRDILTNVPFDVDILINHGPAYGILDRTAQGEHAGCKDLLHELKRIQPAYLIHGHIHNMYGIQKVGDTTHVNAAILNDSYEVKNRPVIINI
jgi:calcineurin-like phosphoesterase family protein